MIARHRLQAQPSHIGYKHHLIAIALWEHSKPSMCQRIRTVAEYYTGDVEQSLRHLEIGILVLVDKILEMSRLRSERDMKLLNPNLIVEHLPPHHLEYIWMAFPLPVSNMQVNKRVLTVSDCKLCVFQDWKRVFVFHLMPL